jgi:hypothetical protein
VGSRGRIDAVRRTQSTSLLSSGDPGVLVAAGLLLLSAQALKTLGWTRLFRLEERTPALTLAAGNGGAALVRVVLPGRFDEADAAFLRPRLRLQPPLEVCTCRLGRQPAGGGSTHTGGSAETFGDIPPTADGQVDVAELAAQDRSEPNAFCVFAFSSHAPSRILTAPQPDLHHRRQQRRRTRRSSSRARFEPGAALCWPLGSRRRDA